MFNINIEKIKEKLFSKGITNEKDCNHQAEKIVNSIYDYADKLKQEKEEKAARYHQAWEVRNLYKQQVSTLESQYATNPNLKSKYNQAVSLFQDAESYADIARNSYANINEFAGKMGTQAVIANSIIC